MILTRAAKPSLNRRGLAIEAMQAATATRAKAKLDQTSAVCIFGICDALGVVVRFNSINMEGMYQRGRPPRIHLSALRPLGRRTFTCAHELGHHVFGHGSSIDELREDAKARAYDDPKEFLADAFAGFMLMPTIGLRRAFSTRGWAPNSSTSPQLYTIACEFGVGYSTMVTHLASGARILTQERAAALQRITPRELRAEILGGDSPYPLIVADRFRTGSTLDVEVNTSVLLPRGTLVEGKQLALEQELAGGSLFRAIHTGIARATSAEDGWSTFVRVAQEGYVGLAQYRHLEADPDE